MSVVANSIILTAQGFHNKKVSEYLRQLIERNPVKNNYRAALITTAADS